MEWCSPAVRWCGGAWPRRDCDHAALFSAMDGAVVGVIAAMYVNGFYLHGAFPGMVHPRTATPTVPTRDGAAAWSPGDVRWAMAWCSPAVAVRWCGGVAGSGMVHEPRDSGFDWRAAIGHRFTARSHSWPSSAQLARRTHAWSGT